MKARIIAPRKCLAFSFADIVRDFLRKPENAWVSAPIGTWSGRRLPPEACREDDTVRKWCADAYCLSTNCGGRVHRGVISGLSKAYGATSGGLGGREPF